MRLFKRSTLRSPPCSPMRSHVLSLAPGNRAILILFLILLTPAVKANEQATALESVNAQATKDIEQLYANWRVAVESSDIPGYVASLHEHVRMLPPGAPPVQDASSYAAFLEPVFAAATYQIEVDAYPEITVVGDIAVAEYIYTIVLTLKDPGEGVTEPGAMTANRTTARYSDVLRKTEDGWRVWRHTWHNY